MDSPLLHPMQPLHLERDMGERPSAGERSRRHNYEALDGSVCRRGQPVPLQGARGALDGAGEEVAGGRVAACLRHRCECGRVVAAVRLRERAAGVEAAAGRRRGGVGHVAGQCDPLAAAARINMRHRRQQRLRVGVGGFGKQAPGV